MKTLLLASGAALVATVATPAAASKPPSLIIAHVEVRHGDLNLATGAGAGTMLERLSAAASNACGGRPRPTSSDPLGPSKQRAYRLCRIAAIDTATLRLDAPLVRARWLEDDEAVRSGDEARRTTADLLRQAGLNPSVVLVSGKP